MIQQTVTLDLPPNARRALRELVETYLADDGPAFECMPEWPNPHTPETLTALREIILKEFPVEACEGEAA